MNATQSIYIICIFVGLEIIGKRVSKKLHYYRIMIECFDYYLSATRLSMLLFRLIDRGISALDETVGLANDPPILISHGVVG